MSMQKIKELMDKIFLGYYLGIIPKFMAYFIIPMLILAFLQYFGVVFITDAVLKIASSILAIPLVIGIFWLVKATIKEQ